MNTLIVTHVMYRNNKPGEGPYSSVQKALKNTYQIGFIKIPLINYENPVICSYKNVQKEIQVPVQLGKVSFVKYFVDFILTLFLSTKFLMQTNNPLIIGIDPLSTLPVILLKPFFKFKLVFYSVDFNENRFSNALLQKAYEYADKWSSRFADQVWGVCDSLNEYKEKNYNVKGIYVPNSFSFDNSSFENYKNKKSGNRCVWTGSILTDKQVTDIISLCKEIQKIRPEMEFWFIPANKIENFKKSISYFGIKNARIFDVQGQKASRELVAQCDIGIALYNKDFGSTRYIEPIKIWEYMMCGLPFIISSEPSLNAETRNSGCAYLLSPDNKIPSDGSLRNFVDRKNIESHVEKCLYLAEKYDAKKTMGSALKELLRNSV